VRIDDLVQPEPADPRVRRPSRRLGELVMTPLAPEGSALQAYRIVYPPSAEKPVPKTHDGYEWLYVLTGRLALTLDDHTHELARGEAAEFDTRTPHSMAAAGNRPATVLSIFNASGERMHTHTPQ
jgi:quercetin dioxygenase-like cupin family protein